MIILKEMINFIVQIIMNFYKNARTCLTLVNGYAEIEIKIFLYKRNLTHQTTHERSL